MENILPLNTKNMDIIQKARRAIDCFEEEMYKKYPNGEDFECPKEIEYNNLKSDLRINNIDGKLFNAHYLVNNNSELLSEMWVKYKHNNEEAYLNQFPYNNTVKKDKIS